MRLFDSVSKLRLAMLLGATTGLAVGCSFTFGKPFEPTACGDTNSNSEPQDDGTCVCDAGYDWCNPTDDDDFGCCEDNACASGNDNHVSGGECVCDIGFDWCSSDPDDLSCCPSGGETGSEGEAEATGDGDGDGDSSTSGDGDGDNLPPEDCTQQEQDDSATWCTTDAGGDLSNSRYFLCVDLKWQEFDGFMDDDCVDQGFDFAYGCEYYPDVPENKIACGTGTGAACTDSDAPVCVDTTTIEACLHSRLGTTDCQVFCENGTANGLGQDFEFGECGTEMDETSCLCFDS